MAGSRGVAENYTGLKLKILPTHAQMVISSCA